MACEARLLAPWSDCRRGFDERSQASVSNCTRVAEVAQQQPPIDADVEIEDPGAEFLDADEPGAGVVRLVAGLQIVDGGVVVVFGVDAVRGHGVCHLHRRLAIELRVVGQHPSEHGDVRRRIGSLKQIVRLGLRDGFSRTSQGKGLIGECEGSRSFFGRNECKLLDKRGLGVLFTLDLAEGAGDAAGDLQRVGLVHAAFGHPCEDVLAKSLRTARWPSSFAAKTSDVRQARFRLCEEIRRRGTPPKMALLGRPVSSRLRLDGP